MNIVEAVISSIIGYFVFRTMENLNNSQGDTMSWLVR